MQAVARVHVKHRHRLVYLALLGDSSLDLRVGEHVKLVHDLVLLYGLQFLLDLLLDLNEFETVAFAVALLGLEREGNLLGLRELLQMLDLGPQLP